LSPNSNDFIADRGGSLSRSQRFWTSGSPVRNFRATLTQENAPLDSRWRWGLLFRVLRNSFLFSRNCFRHPRDCALFCGCCGRTFRQLLSPGFDLPPTDAKKLSAVANTWAEFPPGFPRASTRNSFPPQLSHSLPVLSYCWKLPNKGKLQALNAWMSRR